MVQFMSFATLVSCLFFVIYFITSSFSYVCIHDKVVKPPNFMTSGTLPATYTTYKEFRLKRDKESVSYEPLMLHPYFDEIDPSMPSNVMDNIDLAMKKAILYLSETFQVRKVNQPFLLEREGCTKRWSSGVNVNKCNRLKSDAEICAVYQTEYQIPDMFLNRLDTYDYSDTSPRATIEAGQGVLNANFILFIISKGTSWCTQFDVQAYGSFCRVDAYNRPVAGILNLCPDQFSRRIYNSQHYYNVLLHEIFHILGFSNQLFGKFKGCLPESRCYIPGQFAQNDAYGTTRLVFPQVVANMNIHANCSEVGFGAPMEKASSPSGISSHWNPLLMYTSIMTPDFTEDDYVFVDNMTLATFASTGWYAVNYSKAGNFVFGKGQGCQFGYDQNCGSKYLCNPNANSTGCDIMHRSIGRCQKLVDNLPCGIFKPKSLDTCIDKEGQLLGSGFHAMDYEQRCFLFQKGNDVVKPGCFVLTCRSTSSYEIHINTTQLPCQFRDTVTENGITVHCAHDLDFCSTMAKTARQSFCIPDRNFFISIRMKFGQLSQELLLANNNFKNFKVSTVRAIAAKLNIPVNYIINASLNLFKMTYLDFSICPPEDLSENELGLLIENTQKFLDGASFDHILKGDTDLIVTADSIQIDPSDVAAFKDYEGFRMLITFPIVGAVFLAATVIASIGRFYLTQKHRPQRTMETEESEKQDETESANPVSS